MEQRRKMGIGVLPKTEWTPELVEETKKRIKELAEWLRENNVPHMLVSLLPNKEGMKDASALVALRMESLDILSSIIEVAGICHLEAQLWQALNGLFQMEFAGVPEKGECN